MAKQSGLGIRKFKAEKGESWEDVNARNKQFFMEVFSKFVSNQSERAIDDLSKGKIFLK